MKEKKIKPKLITGGPGKGGGPNNNKFKPFLILLLLSFALVVLSRYVVQDNATVTKQVSLTKLVQNYEDSKYAEIVIDGEKLVATVKDDMKDEKYEEVNIVNTTVIPTGNSLKDIGISVNNDKGTQILSKSEATAKFWYSLLPTIIGFTLFFFIAMLLISKMGGAANNAMSFGKSRAKIYNKDEDKVLFSDVAGAEEEKQELQEVVDFLKNPKKYADLGAKIPKGTLLVGPPGTGKTMLARAVAGESGVPFLSISGSEFVEMFVGVGASRVRDLFQQAKKMAPAIIFIDEIDAIGKKRGPGLGGGHDEREQTLNQILTEMDGFDNKTNVIVMGATNRVDVLDKALLRPGRFDRKITVNLPNQNDREKILKIHARNKKMDENANLAHLASSTVGFSGADLGNLMNEAAIITARNNEQKITNLRLQEAFERIAMGLQKKSLVMNDKEKKITAYHEVGHAIIGKLLPNPDPVHKVSILPRGGALGVTWFLPEKDEILVSKSKYLDELSVLYGGRAAEEIFFGAENITTGASNDIEKASNIARDMVMRYGMYPDEIGQENFAGDRGMGENGQQGDKAMISEETQKKLDLKVQQILKEAYQKTRQLLLDNKELHIKIAEDLLEKEELTREEFAAYFA